MAQKYDIRGPNLWLAVFLIFIGILFLLDNFYIIDIGDLWDFWPLILVGIGVIKLTSSRYRDRSSGLTFISIGIIFLLLNFDFIDWGDIWQFWPVILIFIGISIIYKRYTMQSDSEKLKDTLPENCVDAVAIFSGNDKVITSDNFEGGNITAIFGGTSLNLRNAKLSPGENVLQVLTVFGGTEIYVPDDWNVVINALPLFGACEDTRRKHISETLPKDEVLVIKGLVLFGGFDVKSA